jgi:hypothetical protein
MNKVINICGFPVDPEMGLRKYLTHQDVRYEICNHGRGSTSYRDNEGGTWCYYVVVSESQVSPESFAEFWLPATPHIRSSGICEPCYSYYEAKFSSVSWHGGVTFYEKRGGIDGAPRSVKIGCDYAHLYDQGQSYDFEGVKRDAIRTIDSLRELYEFYRRDPWNGMWLPASQMIEEKGVLYSPQSIESRKAKATASTTNAGVAG